MRFVSKSPRYSICFRRDVETNFGGGESQIKQPLWNCQFTPGIVTSRDIEQARRMNFIHHGTQVEEDGVTPVDTAARYGVFDTVEFQKEHANDIFDRTPEGFTDEHRKELEAFLLDHQDEWYRVLEVIKLAPPWPTYDSFRGVRDKPTALRIAERVTEDGYDPAQVILYERENGNRQDVIDALEALLAPPVDADELVAA